MTTTSKMTALKMAMRSAKKCIKQLPERINQLRAPEGVRTRTYEGLSIVTSPLSAIWSLINPKDQHGDGSVCDAVPSDQEEHTRRDLARHDQHEWTKDERRTCCVCI